MCKRKILRNICIKLQKHVNAFCEKIWVWRRNFYEVRFGKYYSTFFMSEAACSKQGNISKWEKNRLAFTFVFGVCFKPVSQIKSNCYSFIYSSSISNCYNVKRGFLMNDLPSTPFLSLLAGHFVFEPCLSIWKWSIHNSSIPWWLRQGEQVMYCNAQTNSTRIIL